MSSINVTSHKLHSLDFIEAQKIAEAVNFDVITYAKKLRSCGPGCDYFSKDKKYFITMLLQHIRMQLQDGVQLSEEVLAWHEKATAAEKEYREMESHHLCLRRGTGGRCS
jgi:hypothetical protein